MIPAFPRFRAVDLSCQDTVTDFFSRHPVGASEYTFTNIFAFRSAYDFRLSNLNNNLVILRGSKPVSMLCPAGETDMSATMEAMFGYLNSKTEDPLMERVPERFLQRHLQDDRVYVVEDDRDQFDYVYSTADLIALSGNRFHDKKNRLNKFRQLYSYEYLALTPDLIEECLAFEDYWCEVKECGKYPGLERERCAILEMLNNFSALKIKGGIIRIGGKVAALTLGERLITDTFVVHIEKANPDIPGLYQAINQEFLVHEASGFRFVNREQDLGVRGLRMAKMSYNPAYFIKKFKVRKGKNRVG